MMHKTIVILGGGLSGLVSANICSHLGIDTIILEKGSSFGGGNRSIIDNQGNIFDYGYHALDENRSFVTTKFFQKVLKNNFRRFKLNRGIVIKDKLFSYNENFSNWPIELQNMFNISNLDDNIKDNLTRKNISKIYGKNFSDFSFNEIAQSYPTIQWSLKNGGKEEDFFGMIYPWFFPRKNKTVSRDSEWNSFHDEKRKDQDHYVLYPKNNGFQSFVDGILNDIDMNYCTIKKNINKLQICIDSKTNNISKILVNNKKLTADLYFWCNSPVSLSNLLKINSKITESGVPQKIIFGNFVFRDSLKSKFHEILVGSINHKINRISFPGKIQHSRNNLVQIEYSFPISQSSYERNFWKKSWLKSLRDLGILSTDNLLEKFSFHSETRGFISKYNNQYLKKVLKSQMEKSLGDNIVLPSFNLGPENINRVVPSVILNTIHAISKIDR